MLSADDNKPTGKPGKRGKKAESRKRKSAQQQGPQQDQIQDIPEAVAAPAERVSVVSEPVTSAPEAATATSALLVGASAFETSLSEALPESEVLAEPEPSLPEALLSGAPLPEAAPPETPLPATSLAESPSFVPATPMPTAAVSYQAIASAYYDYTWQSFDQGRSFLEKLATVRSPDKALQLQSEFAKQAYEGFVSESQKICELHSRLATQRFKRWEDFVTGLISPSRRPTLW